MSRSPGPRARRSTGLAALISLLVAGGVFGGTSLGAWGATADECAGLLTAEQQALVAGIEPETNAPGPGGVYFDGVEEIWQRDGAVSCAWDLRLFLGYAPLSADEQTAAIAGIGVIDPDGDGVYTTGFSGWAEQDTFGEGRWYAAYRQGIDNTIDIDVAAFRERVLALDQAPAPTESASTEPPPTEPTSDGAIGLDTPSTLSTLPAFPELLPTLPGAATAVGLTLVLAAIVALPGKLMETAITENGPRIGAWFRDRVPVLGRIPRPPAPRGRAGRIAAIAAVIAIGAVVASFIDPRAALSLGTARTAASIAVSLLVDGVLGAILIGQVLRRSDNATTWFLRARPGSLLILLVAVILSRVVGFEPGFLVGVVVGLSLGGTVSARQESRVRVLEVCWLAVAAVAAWVAYSLLSATSPASGATLFVTESLSAITVGGLTALVLVLLPLRGLPGGALFRRTRIGWVATYGVAAWVALVVLLPLPESWDEVATPLVGWILTVLGFGAGAITVWAIATYGPWRDSPQPSPS